MLTVVLRVVSILFAVGEREVLPILSNCIGTVIHDPNLSSSLSFFMFPPTLPPLGPLQLEGHSALVAVPTTISNSGIYIKITEGSLCSYSLFYSTDSTSLDIVPLEGILDFPVLLNKHSMNLKILNNQQHTLVVGAL